MKISWDLKGEVLTLVVEMYKYAVYMSNNCICMRILNCPYIKLSSEVRKTSSLEKYYFFGRYF